MVETGIIILLVVGFMVISRLKVNFTKNSRYAGFLLLILLDLNGLMRTSMLTMRGLILLGTLMIFIKYTDIRAFTSQIQTKSWRSIRVN